VASAFPPNIYPPAGAPDGTVWFGGPVDEAIATFTVRGNDLDPAEITFLLGCAPTSSARTGETITNAHGRSRVVRQGFWGLATSRSNLAIEDHVAVLVAKLTSDLGTWRSLAARYRAEIFCGLFLNARNRGFELTAQSLRQLADRGITIGFDIYAPEP
jgi:hypothetical protein